MRRDWKLLRWNQTGYAVAAETFCFELARRDFIDAKESVEPIFFILSFNHADGNSSGEMLEWHVFSQPMAHM